MKKVLTVLLILSMFLLTGCLKQWELTDDETVTIARYAAGTLLKYDKKYDEKLATATPIPTEPLPSPTEVITPTPTPTPLPTPELIDNTDASDDDKEKGNEEANAELTDVIGLDGISLEYEGYELYESYTFGSFSVEPQKKDHELMIVFIRVNNNLDEATDVNLMDLQLKFRLDVNNGTYLQPSPSILLNDFQFLNTQIDAGEGFGSVLVFEVETGYSPETMNLFIMKDDKTVIMKLK